MSEAVWADEAIRGAVAAAVFLVLFLIALGVRKRGGRDEQGQDSGLD